MNTSNIALVLSWSYVRRCSEKPFRSHSAAWLLHCACLNHWNIPVCF